MSKFQIPQQPALHWNYTNPKAAPATFHAFSNQQFYHQTTPQHYLSTSQEHIRNPITPQENSLHSSESSASSYFQTFTDQNTDVLNDN